MKKMKPGQGSARRVLLPGSFVLGIACVVLALTLGVAGAAGTLPFLGSFGSQGSGGGQFALPRGVAVDASSGASRGDVYVADQKNQRVEKFDSVGAFLLTFGSGVNETKAKKKAEGGAVTAAEENVCTAASRDVCRAGLSGEGAGQFGVAAMGVAVDPASGDVYVVDIPNRRVEKFGPAGEFLLAFGKEVDATTAADICTAASGDKCRAGKAGTGVDEFDWTLGSFIAVGATGTVYVGDENRVQVFEPTGQNKAQITLAGAGLTTALAVDSSGDLYAVSQQLSGVRKYSPTGQPLAVFDPAAASGQLGGVAVAPESGDVFLIDSSGEGTRVRHYSPGGTLLGESENGLLEASSGIAVNATGTVYAADSEDQASADRVLFFGEPPREGNPPPAIDAQSVADLGEESAALTAQINPYFLETSYRVQYVPASGYNPVAPNPYAASGGGEVPSEAGIALGGGAVLGDQPAPVTVPGLSPGTAYHYRFLAHSKAGTTAGPDQTFTTLKPGGIAGLPDGRVYEQVSPQKKNGNEAGMELNGNGFPTATYSAGSSDGSHLAYIQTGPIGETASGADLYSVSTRNPNVGWETRATVPPEYLADGDFLGQKPLAFLASPDFSRFLFVATGPFAAENSKTLGDENLGLYRTRGNSSEPEWLSKPTLGSFSEAKPEPGKIPIEGLYPVGGSSPDLRTVYFTYFGTLVPEDKTRAPLVDSKQTGGPWGFYEWTEGALHSAGVLPSNSPYPNVPNPYGAVPAATLASTGSSQRQPFPGFLLNEVSSDGSKAYFVSPQPLRANEAPTPTELYVREQTAGGPKTVLVSRDELHGGVPAPGSGAETAVTPVKTQWSPDAYVYGSADGSRAFFLSRDKLARSAAGAEPIEGTGPWMYEFNLETEKLAYLPGVVGPIAAAARDGSRLLFENKATGRIELWSGGPGPVEVASFSTPTEPVFNGTAANDGSVFAFTTNAVLKQGSQVFNNSAGLTQVYRYDVLSGRLSCASCAPPGAPQRAAEGDSSAHPRVIAAGGARIFFGTAARLVSRDVNGVTDVYEWELAGTGSCHTEEREGGCVYLVSTGTSTDPSFLLENDESGENVFFSTRQGLAKGDTDEAYDVYDARVGGGFPEEAPPAECAGACRPPGIAPSPPALLTTALGASGNLIAPGESTTPNTRTKSTPLTRAQKLAKALSACAKKPKKRRGACEKQARRKYAQKTASRRARRGSGR